MKLNRIISLLLCVLIIMTAAFPAAAEGDEVQAAKKIISVVYDDSGSMKGDRWVYANYATQALIALLNEQDELYLTYMSSPSKAEKVDLGNIEKVIQNIQNWNHTGSTPGQAIDTAWEKLRVSSEKDPSAQFWLVILTDGDRIEMSMDLQSKLESIRGDSMSNGTGLNVVYMGMGPGAARATGDPDRGLYTFHADTNQSINDTMKDVANLISGRLAVPDIVQVDSNTIQVSSNLPLYSISVLLQGSQAEIVSAETNEGKLKLVRNLGLSSIDPFRQTGTILQGKAGVLVMKDSANKTQVIPAGQYTIVFSEPVSKDQVTIQIEPAIGLKIDLYRGGDLITDLKDLQTDDSIDIYLRPVIAGTDQTILPGNLPQGVKWSVEYEVDGTNKGSSSSQELKGIKLKEGGNIIRGVMQIPGFAPLVFERFFRLSYILEHITIKAEQPDPLEYYRSRLNHKYLKQGRYDEGNITFSILLDGTKLNAQQLQENDIDLKVDSITCSGKKVKCIFPVRCALKLEDDGTFVLYPTEPMWFTWSMLKSGDYEVQVSVIRNDSLKADGRFTLVPRLSDTFISILTVLVLLFILKVLIYDLFILDKFPRKRIVVDSYMINTDGSGQLVGSKRIRLGKLKGYNMLLIRRENRIRVNGVTLKADEGSVMVDGRSLSRQFSYGTSAQDPEISGEFILLGLREIPRNARLNDLMLGQTPLYIRTNENDMSMWSMKIDS